MNKAIFFDRDGILIEDTGFPGATGEIIIVKDAIEAVKRINQLNYLVIVVTNQSAVARGLTDESGVHSVNNFIYEQFIANGAKIDNFYYCPHLPNGSVKKFAIECNCRKPEPGLILKAAADHDIDLASSFFIGDTKRDIEAGIRAGVSPVYVNYNNSIDTNIPCFTNLISAINYIIDNCEPAKH